MTKTAYGVAKPTVHEANTETSITLMEDGRASLPIKYKASERLQALEVFSDHWSASKSLRFICKLFPTGSEEM